MGWASRHIELLKLGKVVKFRPKGNSMLPLIKSGALCTVEPIGDSIINKNDIVLCTVRGNQYLHLVSALNKDRFQISNNSGHVNGWISRNSIYGRCIKIED